MVICCRVLVRTGQQQQAVGLDPGQPNTCNAGLKQRRKLWAGAQNSQAGAPPLQPRQTLTQRCGLFEGLGSSGAVAAGGPGSRQQMRSLPSALHHSLLWGPPVFLPPSLWQGTHLARDAAGQESSQT
jgi:hypothetical protein